MFDGLDSPEPKKARVKQESGGTNADDGRRIAQKRKRGSSDVEIVAVKKNKGKAVMTEEEIREHQKALRLREEERTRKPGQPRLLVW